MRRLIIRFVLLALSVAAIVIGLMIYGGGPRFTASVFSALLALVTGYTGNVDDLGGANVGSELRFYAVFWIAYGALLYRASLAVEQRRTTILLLMGLFFAGGVGRLISLYTDGAPDVLFSVLMWTELAIPIAVVPLLLIESGFGRNETGS